MKTKISPAVVGLFVLGGLIITLISLLSLGGLHLFAQPQRFIVYFDESIHGLDLGSPVKLRGVRVGRVVSLSVKFDEAKNRSVVAVICELSRNVITDRSGQMLDVTNRAELERLVQDGLSAQLGIIGLATGLLYVELDFIEDPDAIEGFGQTDPRYVQVPAVASAISAFQAGLTDVMADIKRMDLPGLAKEARALIVTTRQRLDALDTARLSHEWAEAGAAVKGLAASPELAQAIAALPPTLAELRGLVASLDREVAPTATELRATLAEAQQTLASLDATVQTAGRFLSAQSYLGDEASRAMQQLAEAADAVRRLADYLERNPSALLSGRRRE